MPDSERQLDELQSLMHDVEHHIEDTERRINGVAGLLGDLGRRDRPNRQRLNHYGTLLDTPEVFESRSRSAPTVSQVVSEAVESSTSLEPAASPAIEEFVPPSAFVAQFIQDRLIALRTAFAVTGQLSLQREILVLENELLSANQALANELNIASNNSPMVSSGNTEQHNRVVITSNSTPRHNIEGATIVTNDTPNHNFAYFTGGPPLTTRNDIWTDFPGLALRGSRQFLLASLEDNDYGIAEDAERHDREARLNEIAYQNHLRDLRKAAIEKLLLPVDAPFDELTSCFCSDPYATTTSTEGCHAPARMPKCGHVFGHTCIALWLMENNTCPMCRDKVDLGEADMTSVLNNIGQFGWYDQNELDNAGIYDETDPATWTGGNWL